MSSNPSIDLSEKYDFEKHWNNAYNKTPVTNLGWHEVDTSPTLELIEMCNLPKDALLFNAGAGASILINELLKLHYSNIIVNDISSSALTELQQSLQNTKHSNIHFVLDDLTNPSELLNLKKVDLWNDRAVLHFFTEKEQQDTYFKLLKEKVKKGGFVILAEFSLDGAKQCCGLDVFNYNEQMLQERLGEEFNMLKSFNYVYTQPSGNTRNYIYTLFQRSNI